MIAFPNSKLNIGLAITGKRADGYHTIESVFYPINICDSLEILPSKSETQIFIYGLNIQGDLKDNLCFKAWEILHEHYGIPNVHIHLLKTIPMGAGLGGGSSDGAATLKVLNQLFQLNLKEEELKNFALKLGSDCPFFITNKPALVKGRGESISDLHLCLSNYYFLVINPKIHISTKEAYANCFINKKGLDLNSIIHQPPATWRNSINNGFEPWVLNQHPQLKKLKSELYETGAVFASMTGSGSSFFGLFKEPPPFKYFKNKFSNYHVFKSYA